MMNKFLISVFFLFFLLLTIYVYPKSPEFPQPPSDFVQSGEPADVETDLRRGYYTNLSRQEVIAHYEKEFNKYSPLYKYYSTRLNYPPEEAPALIRDQTKSTFLEELVHPLRESLYINGFEPKTEEYAQFYKGIRYNQRVVVRYVPSTVYIRLLVVALTSIFGYMLVTEYVIQLRNKNIKK